MEVQPLHIPSVLLIRPKVFGDARGFFFESGLRRSPLQLFQNFSKFHAGYPEND